VKDTKTPKYVLTAEGMLQVCQIFRRTTWDPCYDFLNIFAKKVCGKIGVFDSQQREFLKKLDWYFRKTPIFSQKIGKNSRKS
jgi:hypothetical protein